MKECKCGCGELIHDKNKNGILYYVRGHHRKGKQFKNEKRFQEGNKNNAWKGGKVISTQGYVMIRIKQQYIQEHRLIMEKHLGRKLKDKEQIHHINGNKQDNRIENLQLHTDSSHSSFHRKQDITTGKLIMHGYRTAQWRNAKGSQ